MQISTSALSGCRSRGSVGLFCGATEGLDARFVTLAKDVGRLIASCDLRLVYGGSRDGLMGCVADGVLEKQGEVLGVLPSTLVKREVGHPGIGRLIEVETMAERKEILFRESDVILVLPGGIGTLDELFEALTGNSLGFFSKPIVIFDAFGFYEPLLHWLEMVAGKGFCKAPADMFCIVRELVALEEFLAQ